ncbi:hypothetical protein L7F22_056896 [Adiantum nelumboides]|nr:hypothetical protein [Adiantum nelumboides]
MTAATTSNTTSRGDWAWPLRPPPPPVMPSPSPPLELQFLPPSAAAASSATRPPAASPWSVDPSRLQKLMMGTAAAIPPSPVPSASIGSRVPVSDFGAFFDPGINKPLPSGWERCLDLKSGEVFIKKCEKMTHNLGVSPGLACWQAPHSNDMKQHFARVSKSGEKTPQIGEQKVDWTSNWMLGKTVLPTQNTVGRGMPSFLKMEAKAYHEEHRPSSPDRSHLCLDLDLRLTSDNSSRLASEAPEFLSSRSSKPPSSAVNGRDFPGHARVQAWKWQPVTHENDRPPSIQEMVSESTMATAVCSKCLMYVLLKKSNPTCPRCFNPIILDCVIPTSSVKKRPRLELSPDDLSLSTDSSR